MVSVSNDLDPLSLSKGARNNQRDLWDLLKEGENVCEKTCQAADMMGVEMYPGIILFFC